MSEPGAVNRPRAPWRRFRRNRVAVAAAVVLAVFYAAALAAPFLAPYGEAEMDRGRFLHPPQRLHWREAGRSHLSPFVYPTVADASGYVYREDRSRIVPVRWFVQGEPYRLAGIVPLRLHLFGADAPERIDLLGTDARGRDVFSRVLFGARVSLSVGLLGIAISFTIGLLVGGLAGYLGGWVDTVVMRLCELMLSVPVIYLLVALRSVLPSGMPPAQVYLGIVGLLALVGWAGLARVVRGMVLAIRRSDYVTAAEALGLGRGRILVRHVLPNTLSFVVVAATVAVPAYILGEVVLSFLGLGIQEPGSSWGTMLIQARALSTLSSSPWLLYAPGTAIFLTVMAFHLFGDGVRDALDPRESSEGMAR
jgi:peptide/nickel transport system permease protein